jgi:hypothetical protein
MQDTVLCSYFAQKMESGMIVKTKEEPWTMYLKGWATLSNASKRTVT